MTSVVIVFNINHMQRVIDMDIARTGTLIKKSAKGNYFIEWFFGSSGPKTREWVCGALVNRVRGSDILIYKRSRKR